MWTLLLACTPPTPDPGTSPPPTAEGWSSMPALPKAMQEVSVVPMGDEVWVLGGFDDALGVLDEIWIFDGAWRQGPDLPKAMHHMNALVVDDTLFVLGGMEGLGFVPTAEAWRLDGDTWVGLDPLPEPMGAGAIGLFDGAIHVAGGLAPGTDTLAFAFDLTSETWTTLPDLPAPRDHGYGFGNDDGFFVVAGRDDGLSNVRSSVYRWDGGSWTEAASIPTARAGVAGALLPDGTVVIAGGEGNGEAPTGVFGEVERYDPTTDSWSTLPVMRTPRHGTGAAPFDGGLLVPGGATVQAFGAVDTVEWLAL